VIKRDKLKDVGKSYEIDRQWYENEKRKKQITEDDYHFSFSLYRGDVFEYNGEIHVYISVKQENKNSVSIERQYLDQPNHNEKDRAISVSPTGDLKKKNRNTLGELFNAPLERLIFRFTK